MTAAGVAVVLRLLEVVGLVTGLLAWLGTELVIVLVLALKGLATEAMVGTMGSAPDLSTRPCSALAAWAVLVLRLLGAGLVVELVAPVRGVTTEAIDDEESTDLPMEPSSPLA